MTTLLIIIGVLICLILIVAFVRGYNTVYYNDFDDEVVTRTTVTTTTTNDVPVTTGLNINGFPIVGMLTKHMDGIQPYVLDPVDGAKWMLNTTDDLYEDAEGKWWGLK